MSKADQVKVDAIVAELREMVEKSLDCRQFGSVRLEVVVREGSVRNWVFQDETHRK